MTDPLLDTPAFAEAVEAARKSPPMDGWERPEVEVVLLAALPAIRRGLAEEIRQEAERRDIEAGNIDCSPVGYAWIDAADHLEGK